MFYDAVQFGNTDVPEEHIALLFGVEEETKKPV
jgi:hypothetical protein